MSHALMLVALIPALAVGTAGAATPSTALTGTVTGTVQQTDGTPVAGAFVAVRGGSGTAVTDAAGSYTITGVSGLVILDASAIVGGATMTGTVFTSVFPPAGPTVADITVRPPLPFPFPPGF